MKIDETAGFSLIKAQKVDTKTRQMTILWQIFLHARA
jgi:hypothetical protein